VALRAAAAIGLALIAAACVRTPTEPDPPPVAAPSGPSQPVAQAPTVIDGIPGGPGQPDIQLTRVPEYGTFTTLRGVALHVAPADYRVAVLIRVDGAWWTKPFFTSPTVRINADGTWECDVTTGGIDHLATEIAAFLVPASFEPPTAAGLREVPASIPQAAVARLSVTRDARVRSVSFAGYEWRVKTSGGVRTEPGPNYFSDDAANVSVDDNGRLRLKITRTASGWQCAEVTLGRALGFGRYAFVLEPGFESIDHNAVFALFTWDTGAPSVSNREIDIEFSRWGVPGNANAQFVVQPFTRSGNMFRFTSPPAPAATHAFTWTGGRVEFESGSAARWIYTGPSVPATGDENVRINLWLFRGAAPSDDREIEVVIRSFTFQAQ
jgi:hypothetical protein